MREEMVAMDREQMLREATRLVTEAAAAGLALRVIGGLAIYARASEATRRLLGRDYVDLDLVGHRAESRRLRDWLEQRGYRPDAPFNAAHGAERLMYFASDDSFHVDVFLDRFRMSHTLDFRDRLAVEDVTVPAAELLLSKLQIAELNLKDARDTAMLLLDHAIAEDDGPGRISLPRLLATGGSAAGRDRARAGRCAEDTRLAASREGRPPRPLVRAPRREHRGVARSRQPAQWMPPPAPATTICR
jgi:hypothetical protein